MLRWSTVPLWKCRCVTLSLISATCKCSYFSSYMSRPLSTHTHTHYVVLSISWKETWVTRFAWRQDCQEAKSGAEAIRTARWQRAWPWGQISCVQTLPLWLTECELLHKLLKFPKPQLPISKMEMLTLPTSRVFWAWNETTHIKGLTQCLIPRKCSVNISCHYLLYNTQGKIY